MHTQRTDSWVALLETGSLKVSPALEGSPGHHPSHLEAPSVGLPDHKQEGPPPHRLQEEEEEGQSPWQPMERPFSAQEEPLSQWSCSAKKMGC